MRCEALAIALALWACGGESKTDEADDAPAGTGAPTAQLSAWAAAAEAFSPKLFDQAHRDAWMTPQMQTQFVLPRLITPKRYQLLQVAELRRVSADERAGEIAFAVDGWPMALSIGMQKTTDGWRVHRVSAPAVQEALVRLIELKGGLPQSDTAEPWPGGLAGKDSNGRPTAAAFVLATTAGLWVDGQPVADNAAAVQVAIRAALKARTDLAQAAHATYLPHVAIALDGAARSDRLAQIADWAVEAGAETLMLIVRDPTGGPAFMPVAVVEEVPAGEKKKPVIRVRPTDEGLVLAMSLEIGEVEETVAGAVPTRVQLAPVFTRLQAEEPAVGILFEPAIGDHARTVALFDALHVAAPDVPIATLPVTTPPAAPGSAAPGSEAAP